MKAESTDRVEGRTLGEILETAAQQSEYERSPKGLLNAIDRLNRRVELLESEQKIVARTMGAIIFFGAPVAAWFLWTVVSR